jgi:tRNA(Arg) A34 adenosine deaminase TadA
MIVASCRPKKKFMQLAIAEAKRARDRGDYAIGAVVTRVTDGRSDRFVTGHVSGTLNFEISDC